MPNQFILVNSGAVFWGFLEIFPKFCWDNNIICERYPEKYEVKRNGSEEWKKCKYVGSLLDTEHTYNNLKDVFLSKKVTRETKFRLL